jgi:tetratricopeptide (TPR) repeat protein
MRPGAFLPRHQLGAYSSDLAALAGFFPAQGGWNALPVQGDLSEANRSWLLAEASLCLMSLGRLEEALGPRRMGLERYEEAGDWNNFCISSENLVDLLTPLGRWGEGEAVAHEALEAAGRVEDSEKRWRSTRRAHAYLGRILHGQGRLEEARVAFERAERVQAEAHHHRRLYGLGG